MQSHFDAAAATWDENPMHRERNQAIAAAIVNILAPTGSENAFEFGAGTGLLARELASHFRRIELADSSQGMVDQANAILANNKLDHIRAIALDLEQQPLPEERFDVVYSAMALHHVRDPEDILTKLATLLAPGGHLAIADLVIEDGSFHGSDVHVHHGFDPAALSRVCERLGLASIATHRPYAVKREGREYPVFLITAQKGAKAHG